MQPTQNESGGWTAGAFAVLQLAIPLAAAGLVYAVAGRSVTIDSLFVPLGVTLAVIALVALIYNGASSIPTFMAAISAIVVVAGAGVLVAYRVNTTGVCGTTDGQPNAATESRADLFCNHTPEVVWLCALGGLLAVIVLGYYASGKFFGRWPLVISLVVAGGGFIALATYATHLSTIN